MSKEMTLKRATIINMMSKYSVVLIQMIYNAVLARILTPEDYGIVAVVNVFVAFFAILADMGIGSTVIQKKNLDEQDINSIFSYSIGLAIALMLGFCALAYPIAIFYSDNVYLKLVPLLSVSILFSTINTVPNGILMRDKKFFTIGIRQIIVSVVVSAVAIVFALLGFKYYALVFNSIVTAILNFVWNYVRCGHKFRITFKRESIGKIKEYTGFLLGFNVINYFSRNLDNLLIGKYMGKAQVGNYSKAYQLMLYPMNLLTNVFTSALHPFLAEHQNDKKYIYQMYIKTVKVLSLLGVYIAVFCYFASEELVTLFYGPQWQVAEECFKILSISIWSQMVCATSGAMFQVLNKTKVHFVRGIIAAATTLLCIFIGLSYGDLRIISMFISFAYCTNFITMLIFLVKYCFEESIGKYLKDLIPDVIIAVVECVVLYYISRIGISKLWLTFGIKLVISGGVYVILLVLLKQMRYFESFIPAKLRKFIVRK